MSKIKINQPIVGIYGEQMLREKIGTPDNKPKELEPQTLKTISIACLLLPKVTMYGPQGNVLVEGDTDKQKFEKWDLYKKFRDAVDDEINLTPEEVILLTSVVVENEVQLVAGQVRDMIQ